MKYRYLPLGDGSIMVDVQEPISAWKTGHPDVTYELRQSDDKRGMERPFDALRWLSGKNFAIEDMATGADAAFPDSSILTYNIENVCWLAQKFHEQMAKEGSEITLHRIRTGLVAEAQK